MRRQLYAVLVSGGRYYSDRSKVFACMDALRFLYGDIMIIHGAATGADTLSEDWAKSRQQLYVGFPAEWNKYGKAAGSKRNREMLELSKPNQVVVFQGNRGTLNMLGLAREAEARGELSVWLPDGEFWK